VFSSIEHTCRCLRISVHQLSPTPPVQAKPSHKFVKFVKFVKVELAQMGCGVVQGHWINNMEDSFVLRSFVQTPKQIYRPNLICHLFSDLNTKASKQLNLSKRGWDNLHVRVFAVNIMEFT